MRRSWIRNWRDWAFALPDNAESLQRGVGGKAILKQAMEDFLPHDLLYRPKKGFTIPVAEWFRGPFSGKFAPWRKCAACR